MKISKLINNNIVSSVDENGREIIIMGRGIGFKAREGMDIPDERIEKVFRLEGEDVLGRFKDLLARMPLEYIEISDEIINYEIPADSGMRALSLQGSLDRLRGSALSVVRISILLLCNLAGKWYTKAKKRKSGGTGI